MVSAQGGASGYGFATTDADGNDTISGLPAGGYKVRFSVSGNYVDEYYNAKATPETADAVTVTVGATTEHVDASVESGGRITGRVSEALTSAPVAGLTVYVMDPDDPFVDFRSAVTDARGDYAVDGLPTGSHAVVFAYHHDTYDMQFYDTKLTLEDADVVSVTAGTTVAGINAALLKHGETLPPAPPAPTPQPAPEQQSSSGTQEQTTSSLAPLPPAGAAARWLSFPNRQRVQRGRIRALRNRGRPLNSPGDAHDSQHGAQSSHDRHRPADPAGCPSRTAGCVDPADAKRAVRGDAATQGRRDAANLRHAALWSRNNPDTSPDASAVTLAIAGPLARVGNPRHRRVTAVWPSEPDTRERWMRLPRLPPCPCTPCRGRRVPETTALLPR